MPATYRTVTGFRRLFIVLLLILPPISGFTADQTPDIQINGAPEMLATNITAYLSLSSEPCNLGDWGKKRLLRTVNKQVQQAAKAVGYYHVQHSKTFKEENGCWTLILDIKPGEPVRIDTVAVDVRGDARHDEDFNALLSRLPLIPGEILNHAEYENIKTSLSNLAYEKGYFDAGFETAKLQINPEIHRANVRILFNSGRRYRYGNITIDQSFLADEFVARYLPFEEGDYYSVDELLTFREVLTNSRYFEQITVREQLEKAEDYRIPVSVKLTPRKRRSYAVGLGAATDTGPRLKFEYVDRYLNKQGHTFSSDLILSPVISKLNADYRIPLDNPATEHLGFYAGYQEENVDTQEYQTLTLGSRYSTTLGPGWTLSYFLNYQQDDFTIAGENEFTRLLIPGISSSITRADNPVYPLKGWRIFGQLRGANESIFSDTSFSQINTNFKLVHKLGPGRILARLDAGKIETGEFTELPSSIRFFAGGDNSVRGYGYKDLGPLNSEGEVIGGQYLLAGSVEYDYRFSTSNWAAALFYDQGNAFNDKDNINLKRGAGIGMRWLSPIGPIRLDIAKQLDDEEDYRIHISMGPDL